MDVSRNRSRGGFSTLSFSASHKTGGIISTSSHTVKDANGEYSSFSDVVTKDYFKRIARGDIVNNGFTQSTTRRETGGTSAGYRHTGGDYHRYPGPFTSLTLGVVQPVRLYSDGELQALITESATSCMARVASSQAAGFVTLGELGETLAMLKNPLKNLNRFLAQIRANPVYRARSRKNPNYTLGDYLSDEWMQLRYGLRPFLFDVEQIVSAIGSVLSKANYERHTARALVRDRRTDVRALSYDDGTFIGSRTDTVTHEISVRSGCLYDWPLEQQNIAASFGLRLSDLPSAGWDLVPASFVLDWFTNVGDFISAISPVAGVHRLAEWYVVREKYITVRQVYGCSLKPAFLANGWSIDGSAPGGTDTITVQAAYRRCALPVGLTYRVANSPKVLADKARMLDLLLIGRNMLGK